MRFVLIPLDATLPAVQAYLDARGDKPLDPAEVPVAAEVLEKCVRTGELLVNYVVAVGGHPSHN